MLCQSDDNPESSGEQSAEDESDLLHSASSSTERVEFQPETAGCGVAAAVAADVRLETVAGTEQMPEQGACVCCMVEFVIIQASYNL